MALLDPVRTVLDAADDKVDAVVNEIDKVKAYPFIGPLVTPYVATVDQFRALFDQVRAEIDKLDPPAAPAKA